ncbi:hypothetical protein CDD83_434 [Cordyceps sp. RAO-2017]|nr:hypothetical protein CDD83_434 [Cordyceps sp. RAO-2017]
MMTRCWIAAIFASLAGLALAAPPTSRLSEGKPRRSVAELEWRNPSDPVGHPELCPGGVDDRSEACIGTYKWCELEKDQLAEAGQLFDLDACLQSRTGSPWIPLEKKEAYLECGGRDWC